MRLHGMDVISIVRKKHQQVTQFEARINAPRSREHPKLFTSALITSLVKGENVVDEAAVLRSIELSTTKDCLVQFTLAQVFAL